MCGEVFSSKFSPEYKARVDQPHKLARPGRWSVIYQSGSRVERAHFDGKDGSNDHNGYATEAAADEARRENRATEGMGFKILRPAEQYGDHNAAALSHAQLVALGNAILNNNTASYEVLRQQYADLTRGAAAAPAPSGPKRPSFYTKAEAAAALVNFLTDNSGDYGNSGSWVDVDQGDGGREDFRLDNDRFSVLDELVGLDDDVVVYGSMDYLRDLVKAYHAADE